MKNENNEKYLIRKIVFFIIIACLILVVITGFFASRNKDETIEKYKKLDHMSLITKERRILDHSTFSLIEKTTQKYIQGIMEEKNKETYARLNESMKYKVSYSTYKKNIEKYRQKHFIQEGKTYTNEFNIKEVYMTYKDLNNTMYMVKVKTLDEKETYIGIMINTNKEFEIVYLEW